MPSDNIQAQRMIREQIKVLHFLCDVYVSRKHEICIEMKNVSSTAATAAVTSFACGPPTLRLKCTFGAKQTRTHTH